METYPFLKAFHLIPKISSKGIFEETLQRLFSLADIQLDGRRPWDINVHDARFYKRVLTEGSLGLGESYMDGWWDCSRLDEFFYRVLKSKLDEKVTSFQSVLLEIVSRLVNLQSKRRAGIVAQKHYDMGNDLYAAMLDPSMNYSCGYWKQASTLEDAQISKLELVCQKLYLKSGMTLLDIGCGWGSLAKFAASKYGVSVVGITLSKEQQKWAQKICKGLPVEIKLQDYREIQHQLFDRIVSIGMFEHVGYQNYGLFMKSVHRNLKEDGLFLLHTIGSNQSDTCTDAWINKYIFPNSMLPSAKQITESIQGLFIMEDWHNFGADYDKTLLSWQAKFIEHWPELAQKYGPRFYRMWVYYLSSCAAAFRVRKNQLWQIILSKSGVEGGYIRSSL
ncbi:MAG: hypothetical protein ACD_73C00347G0003 [uncultured bacterium]|nr:MAG: hypothetical protein ACD_73C00347G0003 [uncultured bacterium]